MGPLPSLCAPWRWTIAAYIAFTDFAEHSCFYSDVDYVLNHGYFLEHYDKRMTSPFAVALDSKNIRAWLMTACHTYHMLSLSLDVTFS